MERTDREDRGRIPKHGMIIAEATQVSDDGQGYPLTPGIYTPEMIAAWKKITDAVHAKGSLIYLQIWHCGRVSHTSYQPGGKAPPAPSAVRIEHGVCITMEGPKPYSMPREMTIEEIKTCVQQFRQGAINAMEAGFDGVEIHGANGYLLDEFLKDNTNKRTDEYGGSLGNRFRIVKEIVQACQEAIGKDKVAVHLTPGGTFNDCADDVENAEKNMEHHVRELEKLDITYLHIKLSDDQDERHGGKIIPIDKIRQWFSGVLITNNRYNELPDYGEGKLGKDYDAIAFARAYLANPDLPARIAKKGPLNPWDHTTFFGGTSKGYTDYPTLEEAS